MARPGPGSAIPRLPRNGPSHRRRSLFLVAVALVVLAVELITWAVAPPAGAQEVKPSLTVDGPGPCRRIGGDWLQPGYCEFTGPLRVGPDDDLVLAVGAFLLGPVEVEGRLEVRGEASLVFFFGDLAARGQLAVTAGGVAYVAGPAESPGGVELAGGGRMEILSDGGSLTASGRFDVAGDGRLDVYGTVDNRGEITNLGVVAVWCGGSLSGEAPLGMAAQVQDCLPPEISLVSRTPTDARGWNRGTVTVIWACTDESSGVVAERVTAVLRGDGVGQTAFGRCTDLAGNTATGVVTGINIERPAPRTGRPPAPPVVVHLKPAAPAPPPATPSPPIPATIPAAVPPTAPPEAALAGPSITDAVSSPDLPPPQGTAPPAIGSATSTSSSSLPAPTTPVTSSASAPPALVVTTSSTASLPPTATGSILATTTTTTCSTTSSSTLSSSSSSTTTTSTLPPTGTVGPATTGAAVGAAAATTTTLGVTPVAPPPTTVRTGGTAPPG